MNSLFELICVCFGFGIVALPLILIIINNDKSVLEKVKKYAEANGFLYVDNINFVNLEFADKDFLDDDDLEINRIEKEMYEQDEEIIKELDEEKRKMFEAHEAKNLIPARFSKHYETFDLLNKGEINEYTAGLFKLLDNTEVSIFNYNWEPHHYSSSKRAASMGAYIVCILYNKDLTIPEFYMRSRNSIDGLLNNAGSLFEEDKTFSKTFIIESPDVTKVKEFLNNRIRNAFLNSNKKEYYYRAKGGCFMVYHSVSFAQYKLEKKTELLKNALEIFNSMLVNNTEIN